MAKPDLAVLVVHGIGTQRQGDTLNRFVDPLYRTFSGFSSSTAAPQFVDNPPDPELRSVRLTVPGPDNDERDWLIAESWWADAFDVPDRSEFARWMFTFAPMFVFEQLARVARRARTPKPERNLGRRDKARGWATYVGKPLGARVLMVIAALVSALLSVVMFGIFLVGLLPGKWSGWVRKKQLALSASVGDTYAYLGNSRRRRVMTDKIHADLKRLLACVDGKAPLAIVAHSQGAALTHVLLGELLTGGATELSERRVTYVTYGGAIAPYAILTDVLEHPRWQRVCRTLLSLAAMGSGAVAIARGLGGSWDAAIFAVVAVALGFVASRLAWKSVMTQERPTELHVPTAQQFRWCDFWGTVDPVPNGSLKIGSPIGGPTGPFSTARPTWDGPDKGTPVSYESTNRLQPWGDHSAYVSDDEDFMTRVIVELGRLAGWQNDEDPFVEWPAAQARDEETALETARRDRRRRGFALLVSQIALVVAFAVFAILYRDAVAELGRLVDQNLPEFVRSAVGAIVDIIPEAIRNFFLGEDRNPEVYIGLGATLVALGAAFGAGVLLWSMWQTAASRAFRTGRKPTGAWTRILGVAFVVLWASLVAGAGVSAWKLDDVPEVPDTGVSTITGRLVAGFEDCTAGVECPDIPVAGEIVARDLEGKRRPRTKPVTREKPFKLELRPGFYTITATSPGLGKCDQRSIDLREGQLQPDPFDLRCDAGSRVSP